MSNLPDDISIDMLPGWSKADAELEACTEWVLKELVKIVGVTQAGEIAASAYMDDIHDLVVAELDGEHFDAWSIANTVVGNWRKRDD